ELGRMKADRAIDPLLAALAGDRSPVVRDAAARALGLIGSPRALTALLHAAQADNDRDVRHSAPFAVEVIQTNSRRETQETRQGGCAKHRLCTSPCFISRSLRLTFLDRCQCPIPVLPAGGGRLPYRL